jgi:hypothetical protein
MDLRPTIALLLALALPAQGEELPMVHLTPGSRAEVRGDRVFRALDAQGRPFFFKRTTPGAPGRAAEVLLPRLLTRAGVATPRVRPVRVAGLPGEFLRVDAVDRAWARSAGPVKDADMQAARWRRRVDLDTLRTIQLVDAITANADRHGGNLLGARENHRFFPRGDDRLRVIPIDHDLALRTPEELSTRARSQRGAHLYGLTSDLGRPVSMNEVVAQRGPLGSPAHMLGSNDLTRQALRQAAGDPQAMQAYVEQARRLRADLSDEVLRRELGRLSHADLGGPDPEARRRLLEGRLRARRDALPGWLEGVAEKSGLHLPGPVATPDARRPPPGPARVHALADASPATLRHAASTGTTPRPPTRVGPRPTRISRVPGFRLRLPRLRLFGRLR